MHKSSCKPAADTDAATNAASCFKEYGLEVCEEILTDNGVAAIGRVDANDTPEVQVPKEAWENTGMYTYL